MHACCKTGCGTLYSFRRVGRPPFVSLLTGDWLLYLRPGRKNRHACCLDRFRIRIELNLRATEPFHSPSPFELFPAVSTNPNKEHGQ